MNQGGMIVSVIAIAACLVLALRNRQVRSMGAGKTIRLIAIWTAIILGLVLVIHVFEIGLQP